MKNERWEMLYPYVAENAYKSMFPTWAILDNVVAYRKAINTGVGGA